MQRFKRIVVGVDLGEAPDGAPTDWVVDPTGPPKVLPKAVERAYALAAATGAEVRLVVALPFDARTARFEQQAALRGGRELRRAAVRRLTDVASRGWERNLRVSIRTRIGVPGTVLRDEAKRFSAELIVVGGGHRKGLAGLGGTSVSVFRDADVAVWIARMGPNHAFRGLLASVIFDEHTHGVLRLAASYARTVSAPLHVLHVLPPDADEERVRSADAALRGWLDVHAHEAPLGRVIVRRGDPVDSILISAREVQADAVFIGPSNRSRLAAVLGGRPSSRLLGELDCSLVCARAVAADPPAEIPGTAALAV